MERAPLDRVSRGIVDALAVAYPNVGVDVEHAAEARSLLAAQFVRSSVELPVESEDLVLERSPGLGGPLPLRRYWPRDPLAASGAVIVFLHGGGWTLCSVDTHDAHAQILCAGTGAVVVSVDYRLAPEFPYPAAVIDAYDALRWTAENAARFACDPARVGIAGDSSGANVAAATALLARDLRGPSLSAQLLLYPALDPWRRSESYRANGAGYFLTEAHMAWYWRQYLGSGDDVIQGAAPRYAALLEVRDLEHLPPACVVTAEFDPLRDEGELFRDRLEQAGNQVFLQRYHAFHGFFAMGERLSEAKRASSDACAVMRELLSTTVAS